VAYLKKEYRELLARIDKELKKPTGWYYFVKKEQRKQNFITKSKGICTCQNCNTQFISDKKINETEKCPKCKNTYIIKRENYSWHIFEEELILLDKLDDNKWVIRLFEIFSRYTPGKVYHSPASEYGRIILEKKEDYIECVEFANNRLTYGMWGSKSINHTKDGKKWRQYDRPYRNLETEGKVYSKNLQELFKDTEYQYSQLWELAEKEDNIDIQYLMRNNLPSIELLIKMKLYKLALCPKTFNISGNFEKRFKINKRYYNFMRDNNIDINELEILRFYKKENIKDIRYLRRFQTSKIKEISEFIPLDKFVEYTKKHKVFDIYMYTDYIKFANELGLDLKNKKYMFPDQLQEEHDKLEEQVKIKRNKDIINKIKKRYNVLKKNIYENKKYIITPANSMKSLENESKQQNNCVRTYAERYAKGKCDIYFLRESKNPKKSLVTVQVMDNKVIQSRTKNNGKTNRSQENFLKKWEKEILKAA
jgi:hypothetical protein